MMLLYLLAVMLDEPLAAEPPAALTPAAPPHNYLHPLADGCGGKAADEVVVCAEKDADQRYRVHPIDDQRYADPAIRAETKFAGGVLGVTAVPTLVGGIPSNRIMLNFKIKF